LNSDPEMAWPTVVVASFLSAAEAALKVKLEPCLYLPENLVQPTPAPPSSYELAMQRVQTWKAALFCYPLANRAMRGMATVV
jgi:hypothetical protein